MINKGYKLGHTTSFMASVGLCLFYGQSQPIYMLCAVELGVLLRWVFYFYILYIFSEWTMLKKLEENKP